MPEDFFEKRCTESCFLNPMHLFSSCLSNSTTAVGHSIVRSRENRVFPFLKTPKFLEWLSFRAILWTSAKEAWRRGLANNHALSWRRCAQSKAGAHLMHERPKSAIYASKFQKVLQRSSAYKRLRFTACQSPTHWPINTLIPQKCIQRFFE